MENFQRQTMRQAGGDGMGVLKYITDEEYEKVKDHELSSSIWASTYALEVTIIDAGKTGSASHQPESTKSRLTSFPWMGVLKYITDEEYEKVKDHELIEEISYNRLLSDQVLNEELQKRHGELYYMDDAGIKLGFCHCRCHTGVHCKIRRDIRPVHIIV